MAKSTKKNKKPKINDLNRMTINVKTSAKYCTKLNIGKDALLEIRAYTEDVFIPYIMRAAEICAKEERKKTIQERDVIRARDYLNIALSRL